MRKEIQEWIEKGNRTEAVRLLEEMGWKTSGR